MQGGIIYPGFDFKAHVDNPNAHHLRDMDAGIPLKRIGFNIWNPNSVQGDDGEVCLIPSTEDAFTITRIKVTLNAAANEVAGDLKYADTFIGLANAVVINDFDTTSGVRDDSSITSGSVPAGKCLYISFDSAPNSAITQMAVTIYFTYD